jgi:hypothetical protein
MLVRGCSAGVGHDLQTRLLGFRLCVERKPLSDVVFVDIAHIGRGFCSDFLGDPRC